MPHDVLLHATDEMGAIVSIWIGCVLVASMLPRLSVARYFTLVAVDTVNGVVYTVLDGVGSEPLVVKRIAATPAPPGSVAASEICTGALYQPAPHEAPLHAMDETGAEVSMLTS